MSQLTKRLLDDASTFRFNGDGTFAREIVDAIQSRDRALKRAVNDLQCILGYLDKHKAGRQISWTDIAMDIGDDIRATILKCNEVLTKD